MKKISKYIFSFLFVFQIGCGVFAQQYRTKGLRLGVDVSRFSLYYFDPGRVAYEFSADYEILRDLYLTGEYGMQTVKLEDAKYNYYSDGDYFRIGFDRNFLKSGNPDEYEMAFIGLRYGYSKFNHSANSIQLPQNYWGLPTEIYNISESPYNAQWLELATGIRAELLKNFFIGWSVRARFLLAHTNNQQMAPYNIPGFGNTDKKTAFGFNFSVYYLIPIYKKEVHYKPLKK
jgi:hypothetical protein